MVSLLISRRRLAVALVGASAWAGAMPAMAAIDLLRTPARMSPLSSRVMLLGIASAGQRLVAVGERGVIVWSDDAGEHWSQAEVPLSVTLTAVCFVDARSGWAVGHDGAVLYSSDAGQSWALQFDGNRANAAVLASRKAAVQAARDPEARELAESALAELEENIGFGPSRPMLDVWFRDARRGWVVGAFGQLFRTEDGGGSWAYAGDALPNPNGLHCNRLTPLPDGSMVIAAEGGRLFRSRDEGRSWQEHDTGYAGHLYGVLPGGPPGVLIAYGFAGHVLRSDDGGQRWQTLQAGTSKSLIGALRLPTGRLLLVDRDRRFFVSDDVGASWRQVTAEPGRPLAAIGATPMNGRIPAVGIGGVTWLPLKGLQ